VDAVGTIAARQQQADGSEVVTVAAPSALTRYVVEKGSVTVDGVSLTITTVDDGDGEHGAFSVALIPHTLSVTTLGTRLPGDGVNLEVDVLAKYVERLLAGHVRSAT
jgi:riboflavin synthase